MTSIDIIERLEKLEKAVFPAKVTPPQVQCLKCKKWGPYIDEFVSPYTGICVECTKEVVAKAGKVKTPTRGGEVADIVFRLHEGYDHKGEWLMMERRDLPGTPRNLFLVQEAEGYNSPRVLLPMVRASLAAIIDAEIQRERERCIEAVNNSSQLSSPGKAAAIAAIEKGAEK